MAILDIYGNRTRDLWDKWSIGLSSAYKLECHSSDYDNICLAVLYLLYCLYLCEILILVISIFAQVNITNPTR
jgi:D-alanyl-lipoteichoic acid acyltransferase DltB (MBOAT superfamily)